MSEAAPAQTLERALLARAQQLADEYRAQGREAQKRILAESKERIRQREEQETRIAQALGERVKRQKLQAFELALRAELENLRWSRVQAVLEQVKDRLARLAEDEAEYLPVLARLFQQAAAAIEGSELVARVNARDLERLRGRWESWSAPLAPGKRVRLAPEPIGCSGGVLLQSGDARIRVDNTFEGRLERLQEELQLVILERLFGTANPAAAPPAT